MTRYNEKEADYIDRLIHSALKEASERMLVSDEQKRELLNRIKNKAPS